MQHPVERLLTKLSELLPPTAYPPGMLPVRQLIPRTSFFPGGHGLWNTSAGAPLPPMPRGGVMVLGQDFHCEKVYERLLAKGGENLRDPTWRRLLDLLNRCGVDLTQCFFTNFIMGLRRGKLGCGRSPGFECDSFIATCRQFLRVQLETQQPRVVLVLGTHVCAALGRGFPSLKPWANTSGFANIDESGVSLLRGTKLFDEATAKATFVALTHPSYRHLNARTRQYQGLAGDEAELRMVRDALGATETAL